MNAAVSYKGACDKFKINYVLGAGLGLKTIGQTGSGKAFPVDFGWKADLNIWLIILEKLYICFLYSKKICNFHHYI